MRFLSLPGALSCLLFSCVTSATAPQQCLRNDTPLIPALNKCSVDGNNDLIFFPGEESTFIFTDTDTPTATKSPYFPWTHQPYCTPHLEAVGSKLCVYTNSSFANGRGISIFTSPKIAEEFAALPPLHEPSSLEGINQFSRNWYTEKIPNKGIGMLAKKSLKRGDPVTVYTPLFLAHPEQSLTTRERENFFRKAVDQLPEKSREAYLSLSTIFGEPSVIAQDVLKANTFEVQVGGVMHLALFPETSRVNHGCGPNAQYWIDHSSLTHYVRAVRDIEEGEEITITYTNPFQPTSIRQEALKHAFHFTCQCSRCASPSSDSVLSEITSLQKILGDWSSTSTATTKSAEQLIDLVKQEGLDGFLDNAYGHAALAYNAVGDAQEAKMYAKLAAEAIELKDGKGTKDWVMWKGFIEKPVGHWSWRFRKSQK